MKAAYAERMEAELTELQTRLAALEQFIDHNAMFHTLDDLDQALMRAQRGAMRSYEAFLFIRTERAKPEPFTGDDYPVVPAELDAE